MNYSKMAVQFVCKMAMPLALMFAACSTDNGNAISKTEGDPGVEMGGSSEEPNIIASIRARAYYASANNGGGSSGDVVVSIPTNIFANGGQIVLTELDSVTLEPLNDSAITVSFKGNTEDTLTGELIPGDDGMVHFDSVSLRSSIVLLEAVSGGISLNAVVNVRDTNAFEIDGLSHLAAYRMQKLVESGMSFTAAKAQTETEIANVFGFGPQNPFLGANLTSSSPAALWRKTFNEIVSFGLLATLNREFGGTGTDAGISEDTKKSLAKGVESSHIFTILQVTPRAFERLGDSFALYYQECLQKRAYFANLLASVFGYGGCSSEREGELASISSEMYELKCESDTWNLTFRKANKVNVAHAFGTMTDSRDGKTYKTVQLDLGDVTQTWMAENLNYETENSSCFREESVVGEMSYCSTYGRIYSFVSGLDSSYRKYNSKEECATFKTVEYLTDAMSDDTLFWAEQAREECDGLFNEGDYTKDPYSVDWEKVVDSLNVLNLDVCPEGWRVPRYEDWITLFMYLREHFDVEPGEELNYLLSGYGNPIGFGMDFVAEVRGSSDWYKILVRKVPYLFTPKVLAEDSRDSGYEYAIQGVYGSIIYAFYSRMYNANRYHEVKNYFDLPNEGFIRCIKDE